MPDTTTNRDYPKGVVTDNILDTLDVDQLADAIDADVQALYDIAGTAPIGDSSHSLVLTGSDIALNTGGTKTILTQTITLTRDQWVMIGGRVSLVNTTSGAGGQMGIYIDVDSAVIDELTTGNQSIGNQGSITERIFFSIPLFSVFLTAGAHTIRLRADKDSTVSTVNARATDVINITSHPCALNIIV